MILRKKKALNYLASNPDLILTFGLNIPLAIIHYLIIGKREGRKIESFNANNYLKNYSDLRENFGSDTIKATKHFIKYGYREGRSDSFMRNNQEIFAKNFESYSKDISKFHIQGNKDIFNFHIIVPFYNCEKYIEKCIKSIKSQSFKDFKVTLIDDFSQDKSLAKLTPLIENDNRFELIRNYKNNTALANFVKTLNIKCKNPRKTINVLLDGDDYLIADDVLDLIFHTYEKTNCLLTYGSYIRASDGLYVGQKYPLRSIYNNEFRKLPFLASHLKTFRHDLYLKIDQNDLKDDNGDFYKITYDMALMLPMLEMAGFRQELISDPLYIYNDLNPINDHKVNFNNQKLIDQQIRKKNPYKKVNLP